MARKVSGLSRNGPLMFPETKDSPGNKSDCFPRDHTLSVYSSVGIYYEEEYSISPTKFTKEGMQIDFENFGYLLRIVLVNKNICYFLDC